ncbi:unnamed protein product, partial [Symbiodinium pilosum]
RTSELDSERIRFAEEKTEWDSRYTSLRRQCESLTSERSQLTSEIEELTDHAAALRDEAQQQRQEMEEAYESVTSVLEREREDAKKEAEASKTQIQQMRADYELLLQQNKEELEKARMCMGAAILRNCQIDRNSSRDLPGCCHAPYLVCAPKSVY